MALDHQEITKYLRTNLRVVTQVEWRQHGKMEREVLVTQLVLDGEILDESTVLTRSIA